MADAPIDTDAKPAMSDLEWCLSKCTEHPLRCRRPIPACVMFNAEKRKVYCTECYLPVLREIPQESLEALLELWNQSSCMPAHVDRLLHHLKQCEKQTDAVRAEASRRLDACNERRRSKRKSRRIDRPKARDSSPSSSIAGHGQGVAIYIHCVEDNTDFVSLCSAFDVTVSSNTGSSSLVTLSPPPPRSQPYNEMLDSWLLHPRDAVVHQGIDRHMMTINPIPPTLVDATSTSTPSWGRAQGSVSGGNNSFQSLGDLSMCNLPTSIDSQRGPGDLWQHSFPHSGIYSNPILTTLSLPMPVVPFMRPDNPVPNSAPFCQSIPQTHPFQYPTHPLQQYTALLDAGDSPQPSNAFRYGLASNTCPAMIAPSRSIPPQ